MERYIENVKEIYKSIDVINSTNTDTVSFELDEIYIPLALKKDEAHDCFIEGYKLNFSFDAKELLTRNMNRVTVKTDPGMGKTTMLRYLAGLERSSGKGIAPIFVKLSDFAKSDVSLKDFLIKKVMEINNSIEDRMIISAIDNGKVLVLLDGLDEVKKGEEYNFVIGRINSFSLNYKKCKMVLTSRKTGFEANSFTNNIMEIEELKFKDISKYINRFYSKYFTGNDLDKSVSELEYHIKSNMEIYKMAKNPFLLSMICLIGKSNHGRLPDYRIDLYKECKSLLIERRDADKTKDNCEIILDNILKEIAYKSFENGEAEFSHNDIFYMIDDIRKKEGFDECKNCSTAKCFKKLVDEIGIIKLVGYNKYAFIHRTFCEYYVSLKMNDLSIDEIDGKINNEIWEEPIKLYSAQIDNYVNGEKFIKKLWAINKGLALRCFSKMSEIIDNELIKGLLKDASIDERIEIVKGLSYAGGKTVGNEKTDSIDKILEILREFLKFERDLEIICHAYLKLIDLKKVVEDEEILNEIDKVIELAVGTKEKQVERYNKYVKDIMVPIKGGTFKMGSTEDEPDRCLYWDSDKKKWVTVETESLHDVKLTDFYMSKYTITLKVFKDFIEKGGYTIETGGNRGSYIWSSFRQKWIIKKDINWKCDVNGKQQKNSNHPVIHINWYEAFIFSKLLGCSLPTEAQWEYACRAGTNTPFYTGENITTDEANYDGNYPYNNNLKGKYVKNTMPVGSYKGNGFGLYDMHGNVLEWCFDWFDMDYYTECKKLGLVENPEGPIDGSYRVLRGGSWFYSARYCRSADRHHDSPGFRGYYVGFRLVYVP